MDLSINFLFMKILYFKKYYPFKEMYFHFFQKYKVVIGRNEMAITTKWQYNE